MAKMGDEIFGYLFTRKFGKRLQLDGRWCLMSYIYCSDSLLFIRRTGRHLSAVLWIRNDLFQIWLQSYRQRVRTFICKYFFKICYIPVWRPVADILCLLWDQKRGEPPGGARDLRLPPTHTSGTKLIQDKQYIHIVKIKASHRRWIIQRIKGCVKALL